MYPHGDTHGEMPLSQFGGQISWAALIYQAPLVEDAVA